jgi:hypothetical protein
MEEKYTLCINQALAWIRATYSTQAVTVFYTTNNVQQQHKLIGDILNKLGIPTGFFEWESDKTDT